VMASLRVLSMGATASQRTNDRADALRAGPAAAWWADSLR
jgi:hypothetical protein